MNINLAKGINQIKLNLVTTTCFLLSVPDNQLTFQELRINVV